jgi:hypothetical protein
MRDDYDEDDNDGKFPDESLVEVRSPGRSRKRTATAGSGRGCPARSSSSAGRMSG